MTTPELRHLLAAVHEALAIPYPAAVGDTEAHGRVLADRAMHARIALENVLARGDDPGWEADYLRARLTEHPPTGYRHSGAPPPQACGRCRTPFDPTDPASDGHARYRETPWCRRCIDNCHDGGAGAEHVCVICDPARYGGTGR